MGVGHGIHGEMKPGMRKLRYIELELTSAVLTSGVLTSHMLSSIVLISIVLTSAVLTSGRFPLEGSSPWGYPHRG
jgi:hypothetical protein